MKLIGKNKVLIDGVEYKLTPVKQQKKEFWLFELTMPNVGSWNGKWSCSENYYARTKLAILRNKELYPLCKEKSYYYNFGDGWGANVKATLVTKTEAKAADKKSNGFCGYDWMIDNILTTGQIRDKEDAKMQ